MQEKAALALKIERNEVNLLSIYPYMNSQHYIFTLIQTVTGILSLIIASFALWLTYLGFVDTIEKKLARGLDTREKKLNYVTHPVQIFVEFLEEIKKAKKSG